MINMFIILIVTFTCMSQSIAQTSEINIIDGDTLRIGDERIRIWGIDAPELKQTCLQKEHQWFCGQESRLFLIKKIDENILQCEPVHKDRYMRTVARCKLSPKKGNSNEVKDLGSEMVKNGWALDYTRYSRGMYAREEENAKKEKKGIWSSEFEAPWKWRKHRH